MKTNDLKFTAYCCRGLQALVFLFCLFVAEVGFAQNNSMETYTSMAAGYCQDKLYDKAILYSDSSIAAGEYTDAYTWYVRGFIFKEAYKSGVSGADNYRDMAVESLLKCMEILAGSQTYNPEVVLKYLATTYYNDALVAASECIDSKATESDSYFDRYLVLMAVLNPENKNESASAEYYMTKAQRLYALWIEDTCNQDLLKKCEESYYKALDYEPGNCDCLYNLSITSYNRGLMLMKADASKDNCKSDIGVTECFEKSFDILQKTAQQCPDRTDVYHALINVCKALGKQEEAAGYSRLLEEKSPSKN